MVVNTATSAESDQIQDLRYKLALEKILTTKIMSNFSVVILN